jgi:hypothetical protein
MIRAKLAELAPTIWFRGAVAVALVIGHLVAFTIAGHQRLGVPFNSSPGEAPYYSDPDANALMRAPRQPHHWSRLIVSRWDAQHYIGFAARGLYACPKGGTGAQFVGCGLAWMPTLGLLARGVTELTGAPPDYVLLVFSLIAAIVLNMLWTSRTIVSRLGLLESYAALIAFNLFASAFYVVTPYNEACVFACTLGCFILLANGRWILAAAVLGAATALRPTAIGIVAGFGCAALVAAWQARKAGTARWWMPLVSIPLAGWGQLVMMLVFAVVLGDAKAYVHAQYAFGGGQAGLHLHRFFEASFYLQSFTAQHMDGVMLFGSIGLVALSARELATKLRAVELTFLAVASAAMAWLPLSAVSGYWGLNRYLMMCPLIFFAAGDLAPRRRWVYALWLVICVLIYWNVEMCSYISHGDPRICPCLGKMQFTMPFAS